MDAVETAQQYFFYVLQLKSVVLADYIMPIPIDFNNIIPDKLIKLFWTTEELSGISEPPEVAAEFGPALTFPDETGSTTSEASDSS